MSKRRQQRLAIRKALRGLLEVHCYSPNKVRYSSLGQARAAGRVQGFREYPCGDHYHLSSRTTFKVAR